MKYFGGCDVGSTYTKAVILDENGKMCADTTIRSKINAEQSAIAAMEEVCGKVGLKDSKDLAYLIGTGYGRNKVPFADENVSEISCHAMGVHVTDPTVKAIIDIGGQDMKCFKIEDGAIHYATAFVRRSDVAETADFEQELAEELGQVTYGYSLYVDDELIGSTEYAGALEDLLDQIKQIYASADTLSIDFVENVRIAEGYVPTESVMNLGTIAELLNSTKTGEVTYTVVKGDTWGQIANSHGMSAAELEALNPGYDINRIHIGDALTLSNAVPYLTVKVTERQNYIEDVNYEVNYVDDASMYQGDERVISKGVFGKADIVADVTYINGEEQERTVISSVTLSDPVGETRARGTKVRPTWYPTGSFRWPCSGRITSRFGYRNTGIRGATTNHKGIDIAVPRGTPIYAADGGTVTYSGWMSGYGYLVQIDHGNGYVTRYGHNSSLTVSVGQHVYKGQQVARAGSTGNSTGNHCHFEVRYNGVAKNPLNYLP